MFTDFFMDVLPLISLVNSHLYLLGVSIPGYVPVYYSDTDAISILYRCLPDLMSDFLVRKDVDAKYILSELLDMCCGEIELEPIYVAVWTLARKDGRHTIAFWRLAQEMNYSLSTLTRKRKVIGEVFAHGLVRLNYHVSALRPVTVISKSTLIQNILRVYKLSAREQHVLLSFVEQNGLGRQVILDHLGISKNTLKVHIRNINKKMQTQTLNDAVEIIRRNLVV